MSDHNMYHKQSITFAMLADVQYAEKPSDGQRYYALAKQRLAESVAAINAQQPAPAFVIQLGDLIDGGDAARTELAAAAAIYDQLRMPGYHVLGNHDFLGLSRRETMTILKMDRAYYQFDLYGWRFIVLDTQDIALQGGWPEDSAPCRAAQKLLDDLSLRGAGNAQPYNGAVSREQIRWLETTLAEADRKALPVIVFGHQPLVPFGEKHTLWNAEQTAALLERYDSVKGYFCGHSHRGGHHRQNGVHYLSLESTVERANRKAIWYTVGLESDTCEINCTDTAQRLTLPLR